MAAQKIQTKQPCRRRMTTARKKNGYFNDPAGRECSGQESPWIRAALFHYPPLVLETLSNRKFSLENSIRSIISIRVYWNNFRIQIFFFSLSDSMWRNLFPVWVGVLAPSVTYVMLHQLFSRWRICGSFELQIQKAAVLLLPASSSLSSFLFFRVRAGTIYSIKMLLEQECAFVNYTKEEDCDRAIQCFNVRTRPASNDWFMWKLGKNMMQTFMLHYCNIAK